MKFKLSKVILFLCLLITVNSLCFAQEPPAENTQEVPVATMATDTNEDAVATDAISEIDPDIVGQVVEAIEQEYAINGFSVGALLFNHNYNIHANIAVNNVSVDVSRKSSDFLSAGLMGRYAILPYNKIGTDLNVSVATTLNHDDVKYSPITTFRAEANLGYAFLVGQEASVYFLAGVGYEHTKGEDIEKILVSGAGTLQAGAGIGLGKKVDIEFIYSYISHAISNTYLESMAALAVANGATSVSYNAKEASVISNVLLGRMTYNY